MVITLAIVPPLLLAAPVAGVMAVVSNVKTIAVLAGKLEPMIVTAVPTGPEVGVIELIVAGAVTVKVAVAELLPAVTVMVWAPAAVPVGITMVLMKIPLARVVESPEAGVTATPSIWKVSAVLVGKLPPLMETVVPAGPVVGVSGSSAAPWATAMVVATKMFLGGVLAKSEE